jgi:hypothetical protein
VKNAEEPNLGPEVFGVTRHLAKSFSHSAKEQVVEFGAIFEDERVKFMRQCEDDMKVSRLKQFLLPRVDPSLTRLSLAFVAMPIATAIV